MKKDYKFKFENSCFVLENGSNPAKRFTLDIKILQFDTKAFYEAIFSDVKEHIDIVITKDNSLDQITDPDTQKAAHHVFDTIVLITNQVCEKLNKECFTK